MYILLYSLYRSKYYLNNLNTTVGYNIKRKSF